MTDSQISAALITTRRDACRELGTSYPDDCPTCGRPAAAPARRLRM